MRRGVECKARLKARAPRPACVGLALLGLLLASSRPADAAEQGFALNRFEPAEGDSDWFAMQSLDLRGHGRWATGIVGDWSHRPLVVYDEQGKEVQALLRDQVYAYLGGSVVLWNRMRIGASFPLVLMSEGDATPPGAPTLPVTSGTNVGDLRLAVDVRVLGEHRSYFSLALGARAYVPTGSSSAMTGDGQLRVQPQALASGRIGSFEYAVRTALNVRGKTDFAGQEVGSEWQFGAAAGVRLFEDRLLVGPEIFGGTAVDSSLGVFDKEATPIEVLLGAHYRVEQFGFGIGAGPGLSRGFGTPAMRALASLQWIQGVEVPAVPPPDRDSDGIFDEEDGCPAEPGPASANPQQNGCPLPLDSDTDGIFDADDACPAQSGVLSTDPAVNGCPPPDRDHDQILDRDDACADEAGVLDTDPARNGCPPPRDTDGDQIFDRDDACPEKPGSADPDRARNGCPRVSLKGDMLQVLDRIEFENGRAALTRDSEPILQAVVSLLREHGEIVELDIQGHTDNKGKHASNMDLSRRRAAAVRTWLIEHGIARERLSSQGVGPDRPIDSNDTSAGRQRNRRVEFHVIKTGDGQPGAAGSKGRGQ